MGIYWSVLSHRTHGPYCKSRLTGKWNGQQNTETTEKVTKRGPFRSTIVTFFRSVVYNFEKFYNCNDFLQTLNLSSIDSIFFLLSTKRNLYGVVTECGVSIQELRVNNWLTIRNKLKHELILDLRLCLTDPSDNNHLEWCVWLWHPCEVEGTWLKMACFWCKYFYALHWCGCVVCCRWLIICIYYVVSMLALVVEVRFLSCIHVLAPF